MKRFNNPRDNEVCFEGKEGELAYLKGIVENHRHLETGEFNKTTRISGKGLLCIRKAHLPSVFRGVQREQNEIKNKQEQDWRKDTLKSFERAIRG